MNKKKHIHFILILTVCFISCRKKDVKIPSMGYDYFPTETGKYVTYKVDSIVYDDFYIPVKIDTFSFLIKEVIDAELEKSANKKTLRVVRFIKKNDTTDWEINKATMHQLTTTTAERVEDNQRYIKLIFPPAENKTWNGNAYNTMGEQKYKYKNVNKKIELNTFTFDTTLTVIQQDEENLIEKFYIEEKYASGVGLIYKKITSLKTEVNGNIKSGFDVTYTITQFGKE
ncbi:MAG: hypothetical protein HND27_06155 [Bacteroidetes bacterium]|nr:hypothetical protein [Bacteroidota bacterium]MCL4816327.1 hypothetical protein [Flavobacteriales bacterium]NOG95345.1 hypothetical protein [Bacteroidota bacterium]WKZ76406.1 MAG: hypothetical protein QY303_05790 [Vicingaceae bacterium]GIK69631.1 MAG: hypothetical protein BroJett020_09260 [Bacteroidota bacterium]